MALHFPALKEAKDHGIKAVQEKNSSTPACGSGKQLNEMMYWRYHVFSMVEMWPEKRTVRYENFEKQYTTIVNIL